MIGAPPHASALTKLGHAQVSMPQDVYMGRKAVHVEVADVLDNVIQ